MDKINIKQDENSFSFSPLQAIADFPFSILGASAIAVIGILGVLIATSVLRIPPLKHWDAKISWIRDPLNSYTLAGVAFGVAILVVGGAFLREDNRNKNRKKWGLYCRQQEALIGKERFWKIDKRLHLNIHKQIAEGCPLTKNKMDAVKVGRYDVRLEDVLAYTNREDPSQLTSEEIHRTINTLRGDDLNEHPPLHSDKSYYAYPSQISAIFRRNRTLETQERLTINEQITSLRRGVEGREIDPYLEYLTKLVCYRHPQKGVLIPLPESIGGGFYTVEKHLETHQGLVVYYLKPIGSTDHRPILVFRGSHTAPAAPKASGSMLSDVAWNGGHGTYKSGKNWFDEVLSSLGEGNSDGLIVTGYSLGGLLAQLFACDYPDRIGRLVTFCSPGAYPADIEKLNNNSNIKENPEENFSYIHYRNEAHEDGSRYTDLVDRVGHVFVGYNNRKIEGDVIEFRGKMSRFLPVSSVDIHASMYLNRSSGEAQEHSWKDNLDFSLNNQERAPWKETLRKAVSLFLYPPFWVTHHLGRPFRSSKEHS